MVIVWLITYDHSMVNYYESEHLYILAHIGFKEALQYK